MTRSPGPVAVPDPRCPAPRLLLWGVGATGRAAVQACECATAVAGDYVAAGDAEFATGDFWEAEKPALLFRPALHPRTGVSALLGARSLSADTVLLVTRECSEMALQALTRIAGPLAGRGPTVSALVAIPFTPESNGMHCRIGRIQHGLRPLVRSLIMVPYCDGPPADAAMALLPDARSVEIVLLRALELLVSAATALSDRWDGFSSLEHLLAKGMDACVGYGVVENLAALRGRLAAKQAIQQMDAGGLGTFEPRAVLAHCSRGIAFRFNDGADIRNQVRKRWGPDIRPTLLTDGDRGVRRGYPVTLMAFWRR